uniref:Interleukin 31 receptor A n=1 Tax=Sphenodon punctatus TaxID=8508 RepID=A0A8D0GPN8_SPHPU
MEQAQISPWSPEVERGSTLSFLCVLGNNRTLDRNASHIIWKLEQNLIAQENYNVINETVSNVTIYNFTHERAHVRCFINVSGHEQLLNQTQVRSGFRPDKPGNFSCIFYYDKNTTCSWFSGKETHLTTHYTFIAKRTLHAADELHFCRSDNGSCSLFYPYVTMGTIIWCQVKAKNALAEVTSEWVYLDQMETVKPEIIEVKAIPGVKQMLRITWKRSELSPNSVKFNCRLRYRNTRLNYSEEVNVLMERGKKKASFNLTALHDFTEYAVVIQCSDSFFFTGWSEEKIGRTEEQAPSREVNLWRVIESSQSSENRTVHLLWKVVEELPSSGIILGYKIQCVSESSTYKKTVSSTNKMDILSLTGEAYVVSVVAYSSAGESPEATLRIPSIGEETPKPVDTVKAFTSNEQLVVEWETSALEVQRYVLEWYKEQETEPAGRSWQYIANATNWTAPKGVFEPFECYNISVYPLPKDKIGAPKSLQAYIQERSPSVGPGAKMENLGKNEVMIKWEEIPKAQRNGFIVNYTVFYKPEGGKELSETVNADFLQYQLKLLKANTQYTAHVMASNKAGRANGSTITFNTLKLSKEDLILMNTTIGLCMLFIFVLGTVWSLKKHA